MGEISSAVLRASIRVQCVTKSLIVASLLEKNGCQFHLTCS